MEKPNLGLDLDIIELFVQSRVLLTIHRYIYSILRDDKLRYREVGVGWEHTVWDARGCEFLSDNASGEVVALPLITVSWASASAAIVRDTTLSLKAMHFWSVFLYSSGDNRNTGPKCGCKAVSKGIYSS